MTRVLETALAGEAIRAAAIMTAAGSVLIILLFALKPLIKDRLPKAFQYYAWLAVLAALLVPFSRFVTLSGGESRLPVTIISDTVERYVITGAEEASRMDAAYGYGSDVLADAQSPALWRVLRDYLIPVWFLGAMILLGVNIIGYIRFVRILNNRRIPANDSETALAAELCAKGKAPALLNDRHVPANDNETALAAELCAKGKAPALHNKRRIPAKDNETALAAELCAKGKAPALYRCDAAYTPMLVGVFKPAIILPDKVFGDVQLRDILLHELTHLRRRDVIVKWLAILARAAHWFNPLVWLAQREISRACELSCDEAVISGLDKPGKQHYGDTLISVVSDVKTPKVVLSTTMCEEKRALKERLRAIMRSKKHTKLVLILSAALLLAVAGAVCALGASGKNAGNEPDEPPAAGEVYENEAMAVGIVFPPEYAGKYHIIQYDVGMFTVFHTATNELLREKNPGSILGALFTIESWPLSQEEDVRFMNENAIPLFQTDENAYFLHLSGSEQYDGSLPEPWQTTEYKALTTDAMINAIAASAYPLDSGEAKYDIFGLWVVSKFLGFNSITRENIEFPGGERVLGKYVRIDPDGFYTTDFAPDYPQYAVELRNPEYRASNEDAERFWAYLDQNVRSAVGDLTADDSVVLIQAVSGENSSPALYLINGSRLLLSLYDDYFELERVQGQPAPTDVEPSVVLQQ